MGTDVPLRGVDVLRSAPVDEVQPSGTQPFVFVDGKTAEAAPGDGLGCFPGRRGGVIKILSARIHNIDLCRISTLLHSYMLEEGKLNNTEACSGSVSAWERTL